MALDLFSIYPATLELDELLSGGRIDKITQPEADEVRLFVRSKGTNHCLVLSANPQAPRCHLTASKRANPLSAPSFLMLLRKHLLGAQITKIQVYQLDRVIKLSFLSKTELMDSAEYHIYVELMNRYSNIILCDSENIILDAVKHIPLSMEREKCVMRGVPYELQPQDKISFLSSEADNIIDSLDGESVFKHLQNRLSGFAAATLNELLFRSGISPDDTNLSSTQCAVFKKWLSIFRDIKNSNLYSPCVLGMPASPAQASLALQTDGLPIDAISVASNTKSSEKAVKKDFMPMQFLSQDCQPAFFATMNEAMDAFYTSADGDVRIKSKVRTLTQAVSRTVTRLEKQILLNEEKLRECENADETKIIGELIISNLYLLKKGMTEVTVENFYTGEKQKLKLDPLLSPSENAEVFFGKYQKLKRAKKHVFAQLEEKTALLEYLKSVSEMLKLVKLDDSLTEIEAELITVGALKGGQKLKKTAAFAKKGGKPSKKEKPSQPKRYNVSGYTVMAGRNNTQNDALTFKTANSKDIWLHLKNAHGSHVIIFTNGESLSDVPSDVIMVAAQIAAATASAAAEVDYTERKNVKRQPGGLPGMVNYANYKTVLVTPNLHEELLV